MVKRVVFVGGAALAPPLVGSNEGLFDGFMFFCD
jgi:hypothetical protein